MLNQYLKKYVDNYKDSPVYRNSYLGLIDSEVADTNKGGDFYEIATSNRAKELENEIANIKQKIAERDARRPKYSMGALMSKYLLDDDTMASREETARQNDLNRYIQQAISNKTNEDAQNDRIDEWTKQYQNELSNVEYLRSEYAKNPSADVKRQLEQSINNLNYWSRKLGKTDYVIDAKNDADATSYDEKSLTGQLDEILKGQWTNDAKGKTLEIVEQLKDKGVADVYRQKIENAGKTNEEKAAADKKARDNQIANWKKTGKVPKGYNTIVSGTKIKLFDSKGNKVAEKDMDDIDNNKIMWNE